MSTALIHRRRLGGYDLPNVQYSSDDGRRLVGVDVPELTDSQLLAEQTRLASAHAAAAYAERVPWLETCDEPYWISSLSWLEERMSKVGDEIARRQKRAGGDRAVLSSERV